MKARLKIFASVFLALIILNAVLYFSLRAYVSDLMLVLEKEQAVLSIQRLLNAFERETIVLDELNNDWAAWDDTYQFVTDGNADYIESNLVDSTFTSNRLDLIVMVDSSGTPVYQQAYDRKGEEVLPVPAAFFSALKEKPEIWKFSEFGQYSRGFLRLPGRVLQLSARPIVTSNEEGPVRGTIIMGRFFSELEQLRLAELTEQQFSLQLDPELVNLIPVNQDHGIQIHLLEAGQLQATGNILDLLDQPLWHLSADFPRSFFQRGLKSLEIFMRWNFLFTGLLALLLMFVGDKLSRAQTRLMESRQSYRELSLELQTILDAITSYILLINKEMQIVWTNRSGAALYSHIDTFNSGKLLVNIPFESLSADNNCPVRKALHSGQPEEAVAYRPDGTILTMNVFPLTGKGKAIDGVICLITDITEKVHLREEAEQRNRLASIGELTAELAHDINNPVGMLLVNLPMIKQVCQELIRAVEEHCEETASPTFGGLSLPFLKEKIPYLMEEMINNTEKIKNLSDDMKTFSQHQVARPTESFNLNRVVDSAVRLSNYRLYKMTDQLRIELADKLPNINGYPHQIEQVIINLLLNAGQALTSTKQAIAVTTGFDVENRQVTLEIRDEGKGIAAEDLHQVTKAFYTTRRDSGGTGLGLSLSSRIVRGHGGTMEITSTLGTGTKVRVTLPSGEEKE